MEFSESSTQGVDISGGSEVNTSDVVNSNASGDDAQSATKDDRDFCGDITVEDARSPDGEADEVEPWEHDRSGDEEVDDVQGNMASVIDDDQAQKNDSTGVDVEVMGVATDDGRVESCGLGGVDVRGADVFGAAMCRNPVEDGHDAGGDFVTDSPETELVAVDPADVDTGDGGLADDDSFVYCDEIGVSFVDNLGGLMACQERGYVTAADSVERYGLADMRIDTPHGQDDAEDVIGVDVSDLFASMVDHEGVEAESVAGALLSDVDVSELLLEGSDTHGMKGDFDDAAKVIATEGVDEVDEGIAGGGNDSGNGQGYDPIEDCKDSNGDLLSMMDVLPSRGSSDVDPVIEQTGDHDNGDSSVEISFDDGDAFDGAMDKADMDDAEGVKPTGVEYTGGPADAHFDGADDYHDDVEQETGELAASETPHSLVEDDGGGEEASAPGSVASPVGWWTRLSDRRHAKVRLRPEVYRIISLKLLCLLQGALVSLLDYSLSGIIIANISK